MQVQTELTVADIAVIVDILIDQSKQCQSVTTASWNLEIINKLRDLHKQVKDNH